MTPYSVHLFSVQIHEKALCLALYLRLQSWYNGVQMIFCKLCLNGSFCVRGYEDFGCNNIFPFGSFVVTSVAFDFSMFIAFSHHPYIFDFTAKIIQMDFLLGK